MTTDRVDDAGAANDPPDPETDRRSLAIYAILSAFVDSIDDAPDVDDAIAETTGRIMDALAEAKP